MFLAYLFVFTWTETRHAQQTFQWNACIALLILLLPHNQLTKASSCEPMPMPMPDDGMVFVLES